MSDQTTTTRLRCPIHDMPDCSPLLNGCSLVVRSAQYRESGVVKQPAEPPCLLAAVVDITGRRYFRWSLDVHTFQPWQVMGAVHVMGDQGYDPDNLRWSDLPPVAVISHGVCN